MSCYYFSACDKHKVRCDVASRLTGGGVCALGHSFMLGTFLVEHERCGVRIFNEYIDDDDPIWKYAEPYKNTPDPRDKDDEERANLIERAQTAEARARQLEKLYGTRNAASD